MLFQLLQILMVFAVHADENLPFWKSKEKVYDRIRQGEIIVVVKKEKGVAGKGAHRLHASGGGQLHAPRDFVFKKSVAFEEIAKASHYIHEAKYDAAAQVLDFEVRAFGHRARMKLKLRVDDKTEPRRIAYEVLEGPVRGMTGHLSYADLGPRKTEVGIESDYDYDTLTIPTFFVEFGLEVVFQRMAMALRSHVESEFRKEKAHP